MTRWTHSPPQQDQVYFGALLVGSNYAKALAIGSRKPFLSINHLSGSYFGITNEKKIDFPFYVCLCLEDIAKLFLLKTSTNLRLLVKL